MGRGAWGVVVVEVKVQNIWRHNICVCKSQNSTTSDPGWKNFQFFSTNSKKIQIFTTSNPGWKKFRFSVQIPKNSKIPLPRTLVEKLFRFSVQIPEIPKFHHLGLEITWFSDRTATLIPVMRCPLLECTYISGRTAALILRVWSYSLAGQYPTS